MKNKEELQGKETWLPSKGTIKCNSDVIINLYYLWLSPGVVTWLRYCPEAVYLTRDVTARITDLAFKREQ